MTVLYPEKWPGVWPVAQVACQGSLRRPCAGHTDAALTWSTPSPGPVGPPDVYRVLVMRGWPQEAHRPHHYILHLSPWRGQPRLSLWGDSPCYLCLHYSVTSICWFNAFYHGGGFLVGPSPPPDLSCLRNLSCGAQRWECSRRTWCLMWDFSGWDRTISGSPLLEGKGERAARSSTDGCGPLLETTELTSGRVQFDRRLCVISCIYPVEMLNIYDQCCRAGFNMT